MRFIFLIAFTPFVVIPSVYVGIRLYGFLKQLFPSVKKTVFWVCYLLFPFSFLISHSLPASTTAKILSNIGYIYLGVAMYALLILLFAELIRFILYIFKRLPQKGEKRRKAHIYVGFIIITVLAVITVSGIINAYTIDTKNYSIKINKDYSKENFRIVAVADTHLGYQIGNAHIKRTVRAINRQNPDLVVFVGDIFDGSTDEVSDIIRIKSSLATIKSEYGVFAVLGNHDRFTVELESFFAESNITLLKDESILIDDSFYLAGRNDSNLLTLSRTGRKLLSDILKDADNNKPIIVLDHRPEEIEAAWENRADLLLCGHSHRGQLFPVNLITKMVYANDYGYQKFGDMHMIVTSGVGFWGPPLRIGTDAEIAVIDIKFGD